MAENNTDDTSLQRPPENRPYVYKSVKYACGCVVQHHSLWFTAFTDPVYPTRATASSLTEALSQRPAPQKAAVDAEFCFIQADDPRLCPECWGIHRIYASYPRHRWPWISWLYPMHKYALNRQEYDAMVSTRTTRAPYVNVRSHMDCGCVMKIADEHYRGRSAILVPRALPRLPAWLNPSELHLGLHQDAEFTYLDIPGADICTMCLLHDEYSR
ncbi:hypothetical protein BDV96DRAFT_655613 [Lophiotrema nucula]|uniref:Uncharacterized protein n=1 Tax=Lophiotrema nucula TaxID=690887 RepID=A0A6A5YEY6_9PLEO|nr:hypothetical protein BDV96DRAFT_655613 [Lophiotrema nucula]